MARFIVLCLCCLIISTAAMAQADSNPVVLSPRVGVEIDPEERAYFGLVLQVAGFRSAYMVQEPTGYYSMIINEGIHSTVRLTPTQFEVLRRFIDRFEYFRETTTRDSLKMLYGVAGHRFPKSKGQPIRVTLWNGEEQKGYLVHADTSVIVLSDSSDVRASLARPKALRIVPVRDVLMVREEVGILGRIWRELYVVSDGSPEQQARLSALVGKRSASGGRVSPELGQYLKELQSVRSERIPGEAELLKTVVKHNTRKLHLTAMAELFPMRSDIGRFQLARGTEAAQEAGAVEFVTQSLAVGVSRSLTSRVEAGLEGRYFPAPSQEGYSVKTHRAKSPEALRSIFSGLAGGKGDVSVSGWQISPIVSYAIIRPDELGRLMWQPNALSYEVRLAAGPSMSVLDANTRIVTARSVSEEGLYYEIHEQTSSAQTLNFGARGYLAVDLRLSRGASLGVGIDAQYYPYLRSDPQHIEFPIPFRGVPLTFERQAIRQSSFLVFGYFFTTRVHL